MNDIAFAGYFSIAGMETGRRAASSHGVHGVDQGAHITDRIRAADMAPARVALDDGGVIGNERPGVTRLSIGFHSLEHVHVAFVDENFSVIRHTAPDGAEVHQVDFAALPEIADLLENVDAHFGDGALAERDAAPGARNFAE